MHKFQRGEEPELLKTARRQKATWDAFAKTDAHRELRDCLLARQEGYCVYCDRKIKQEVKENQTYYEGHIEHLARRRDEPKRAFEWGNLFYSCARLETCGKYKDEKYVNRTEKIDTEKIVDPSKENPLDYFVFDCEGNVVPREKGNSKAEKTIEVFHLNETKLKAARKEIARIVVDFLEYYEKIEEAPSEEDIDVFFENDCYDCNFRTSVIACLLYIN